MNSIASLEQIGINVIVESTKPETKKPRSRHSILGRIVVAPLVLFGAAMATIDSLSSAVAHADHECGSTEYDIVRTVTVDGVTTYYCADGGSAGGTGGGTGGGGGPTKPSGGPTKPSGGPTKPNTPANPSLQNVIDYLCAPPNNVPDPVLLYEVTAAQGSDGSARLVKVAAACSIVFVNDSVVPELGRPFTNIDTIIGTDYLDITPNAGQSDALSAEEMAAYQAVQAALAPASSEAETSTSSSEATAPTDPVSTESSIDASLVTTTIVESTISSATTASTSANTLPLSTPEVTGETSDSTTTTTAIEATIDTVVASTDVQEVAPVADGGSSNGESGSSSDSNMTAYILGAAILAALFGVGAAARHNRHTGHGPTPQPAA